MNIRSGGGTRVDVLLSYLHQLDPNTIVLTEWRAGPRGSRIVEWAKLRGMQVSTCSDGGTANGVLVASRLPFHAESRRPQELGAGVLMHAKFEAFCLLACYFPQGRAKAPFFRRCAEISAEHQTTPFLLVGDLNTGNQLVDKDATGGPYYCSSAFDELTCSHGLHDLWRRSNGAEERAWTWLSNRGNGFRIDHAFGNEAFVQWADPFCHYDHTARLERRTDHSSIIVRSPLWPRKDET